MVSLRIERESLTGLCPYEKKSEAVPVPVPVPVSRGRPLEPEVVKLKEGVRWRDYYEREARRSGKKRPGCGPSEKIKAERRILTKFPNTCSICKGPIHPGDWVFWQPYTGKSRHAPSGYRP